MVPHITDAIQEWVMKQARISVDDDGVEPQVCVIEVSCFRHHVLVENSEQSLCWSEVEDSNNLLRLLE